MHPGTSPLLALMVNRETGAHLGLGLCTKLARRAQQLYQSTVRPLHHHFIDLSHTLGTAFAMFSFLDNSLAWRPDALRLTPYAIAVVIAMFGGLDCHFLS